MLHYAAMSDDSFGAPRSWKPSGRTAITGTTSLDSLGLRIRSIWSSLRTSSECEESHLLPYSGDGHLSVLDVRSSKSTPLAMSEDQEDELLSIAPIKGWVVGLRVLRPVVQSISVVRERGF